MEGISDLKIVGLDEQRAPRIRKEPYIDIVFQLSHKAPADWCEAFNASLRKHPATPKIVESEGLFIEGWVRSPDEIAAYLDVLKKKVAECNAAYIARIEQAERDAISSNSASSEEAGEQGRLNRILATLDYE